MIMLDKYINLEGKTVLVISIVDLLEVIFF